MREPGPPPAPFRPGAVASASGADPAGRPPAPGGRPSSPVVAAARAGHDRWVPAPSIVVFDVNETLSDLSPLRQRFTDVGAPAHAAQLWFTSLLRDGFALTSVGETAPFAQLGREALRTVLQGSAPTRDLEAAVSHVMSGFAQLSLHPDVAPGVRALRSAGLRLVTLSNGAAAVAERLLSAAELRDEFEQVLTVEDAGIWKPASRAYRYAAEVCGAGPAEMVMVAVHPWDLHGAARAGLRTAWINRDGSRYPSYFAVPDVTVSAVGDLVGVSALPDAPTVGDQDPVAGPDIGRT